MSVRVSRPFILVVTGITTAGKSTLLKGLKRKRSLAQKVHFHDMDEHGTPQAGRGHWRRFRIDELLHDAVTRYSKGQSTVLCGVIYPHEVLQFEDFSSDLNLHYLLLQNSKAVFGERVDAKIRAKPRYAFLRSHKSHFVQERDRLYSEVATQLRHFVIDGGKRSKGEVVRDTVEIIGRISK